jgi:hypothetical protein
MGTYALITQNGILSDKGIEDLRPTYYREANKLFRFRNAKRLFDAHDNVFYVLSVFTKGKKEINFNLIDDLYHPITIDRCRRSSQTDDYPGAKDIDGNFNLAGHPDRIVEIKKSVLEDLCQLEGKDNSQYLTVSLPRIYGKLEWDIIKKAIKSPQKIGSIVNNWTQMFNETNAPKKGLIVKWEKSHRSHRQAVLTGPNIFVATPFFKYPNLGCRHNQDFSFINLEEIDEDYFPPTKYKITQKGESSSEYTNEFNSEYRVACKEFVSTTGARTFSSVIIPPNVSHVNAITSLNFNNEDTTAYIAGLTSSLIFDFYSRSLTNGHLKRGFWDLLPLIPMDEDFKSEIVIRALRLNCISNHYAPIWEKCFKSNMKNTVTYNYKKPSQPYNKLSKKWNATKSPVKNHFEREQILCEIDALVSIALGISEKNLIRLYRAQFAVLQQDMRDMTGQIKEDTFPRASIMSGCYQMFLDYFGISEEQAVNGYFQKKTLKSSEAA